MFTNPNDPRNSNFARIMQENRHSADMKAMGNNLAAWQKAYANMEHNRNEFAQAYDAQRIQLERLQKEYDALQERYEARERWQKTLEKRVRRWLTATIGERLKVKHFIDMIDQILTRIQENKEGFDGITHNGVVAQVIKDASLDLKKLESSIALGRKDGKKAFLLENLFSQDVTAYQRWVAHEADIYLQAAKDNVKDVYIFDDIDYFVRDMRQKNPGHEQLLEIMNKDRSKTIYYQHDL